MSIVLVQVKKCILHTQAMTSKERQKYAYRQRQTKIGKEMQRYT